MSTGRQPQVSVIVPVHNGERKLPRLLAALRRQSLPADRFEVIVVDDCSTDATRALVTASGLARLVRAPRRAGSYVARNLGVAASTGGVLAFTDTDCVPREDWLELGLSALEASGADVLAGHVEVPLGPKPTTAALLDFTRYLDQERHVREHGFGATANLWMRRAVLDRIGPFNEGLVTGGDLEYGHRVRVAGLALDYAPQAVVVHEPRRRVRQLARKAFRLGFGTAQHRRHAGGPTRQRSRLYARPGAYIPHPRRQLEGLGRLERSGYRVTRARLVAMHVLQYFGLQLPIVAGSIIGSLAEARSAQRGRT